MNGKGGNLGIRMLVHYTCRDGDGNELETTRNGKPVPIVSGNQDVLPALEKAYLSMAPGETRNVRLKPEQAFGAVQGDLFFEVPFDMLQFDCEPEIGMTVELAQDGDEPSPGTIVEINENYVLVDCNHPLAGKVLYFELTRVE